MDLRTYPTQRIYEAAPYHCTICVEPCEPADGYIDIGPADILCVPCARRAASALGTSYIEATTSDGGFAGSGDESFPCLSCDRTFSRAAALGSHARTHRIAQPA